MKRIDIRRLLLASTLAGLAMAVLSMLPYLSTCNLFFCGWIWAGSIFSAWHYNYLGEDAKDEAGEPLKPRHISMLEGAVVGSFSGGIAAVTTALLYYFYLTAVGMNTIIDTTIQLTGADRTIITNSIPQFGYSQAANLSLYFGLISLLVFSLIGTVGGMVGASWTAIRQRRHTPPSNPTA